MHGLNKGLIKSEFLAGGKKQLTGSDPLYAEEKTMSFQNTNNDDINLNVNSNLFDYLNKIQSEDQQICKFTNKLYMKFKKIFLTQMHIKSYNFLPTPEMNERIKLLNWLKNP